MKNYFHSEYILLLISLLFLSACSQNTDSPIANSNADPITNHIETARQLAGNDLNAPFDFFCIPENTRANSREAPNLVLTS